MAKRLLTTCLKLSTLGWTFAAACPPVKAQEGKADVKALQVDIRAVGDTGYIGGNGRYAKPPAHFVAEHLADLASLRSRDINLLNLEGTLTTGCKRFVDHRYRFAIAPEYAMQLAAWGFNLFALANNHSGDCLAPNSAHEAAMQQLHLAFPLVAWHGVAANPGLLASAVASLTVNGVRVGMVALKAWPAGRLSLVANLDNRRPIFRGMQRGPYDIRILSLHGGVERERRPAAEVVRVAREFIGKYQGDIVFAHHPHVMQGVELLRKADGRYGVIFYSLGNHLHNGLSGIGDGLMARVVGSKDGIVPGLVQAFPLGRANQQPKPLQGAALEQARLVLERSSASLLKTPLAFGLVRVPTALHTFATPIAGVQVTPLAMPIAAAKLDERTPAAPRLTRASRFQRLERSARRYLAFVHLASPQWWRTFLVRVKNGLGKKVAEHREGDQPAT